ncbi:MAG: hypothetical protein J5I90_11110 [Caldilineales bacterium]|nr:hypothetical protein [Caldilineales bacterium]
MIPDKAAIERISPTAVVESNLEWMLGADLELVRGHMQDAIASGYPFLDNILAAHLHTHYPRAIIVLGTSRLGHTDVAQRTALAAAIEMLHLATNIHAGIPGGELARTRENRYMLGVSILTGDYCFSQASMLAARTENPAVVMAFANALAQLTEKRVTLQLEKPNQPYADDAVLYAAAAEAASLLVGLPLPIRYALKETAAAFGEVLADSETALAEAIAQLEGMIKDRPVARPFVNWLRTRLSA